MDDIKPPKKASAPVLKQASPPTEPEAPIKNLDEPIVIEEAELDKKPAKTETKSSRLAFLGRWKSKLWTQRSKRGKAVVITGAMVVIAALVLGALQLFGHHQTIPNAETVKKSPVKAATVASPLTGLQINPLLAKRPVTGVMIENSLDARPQSGLQDAGIVFEAIAEGGITRFLALFQESSPQYIGPVRSLRPYYIDWFTPFDASIAHVGGSPDALSQIRSGGKDLDQFFNADSYWRQSSRPAPHNVYTSFNLLDSLNESKGYTSSKFTSWPRKAEKKLTTPTAQSIDFAISSSAYNVHYQYEAASNTYWRYEGGQPHKVTTSEADTAGILLTPKVIIAMIVPLTNGELDSSNAYYSNYGVNGSGEVLVFQDGGVTQGTWSKTDRTAQLRFQDSTGKPIKLNAGQTWVTVLADPSLASYTP